MPRSRSGARCSIATCNNDFYAAKRNGINLSFFSFPKDDTLRKQWILRCHRKDKINPSTARICSNHFVPDAFERDLQSELLNLPPKNILKKHALPTLNLRGNSIALQGRADFKVGCKVETLEESECKVPVPVEANFVPSADTKIEYDVLVEMYNNVLKENESLRKKLETADSKCIRYQIEISILKNRLCNSELQAG